MIPFLAIPLYGQSMNPETGDTMKSIPSAGIPDSLSIDSIYSEIQMGFQKLEPIFERACFDCHSNRTKYPWYHKLPIVKGLIDGDIKDARRMLNMSKGFPFTGLLSPADGLKEIKLVLEKNDMPPLEYRILHWNAKPSAEEKKAIFDWIDRGLKLISAHGE